MDEFAVLGIGTLVLLAVLFVVVSARRDRQVAVGTLSKETRKADRPAPALSEHEGAPQPKSGREVERDAMSARHTDVAREPTAPPAPRGALDDATVDVTRRQFLNRSIFAMTGIGLAGFGASLLAFLWPTAAGGFGAKIRVGQLSNILEELRGNKEPIYNPEGRFYIQPYPDPSLPAARRVYSESIVKGMEQGIVALYQKCTHLGCRVPWCNSSQWFECPCHGSKYNRAGEKKAGPAPRGLDRFPVLIAGGSVTVDTGQIILGPAIGTNTTGQEAEGPFCA